MLKRGAKAKPAYLKLLDGTYRTDKSAVDPVQPKQVTTVPDCPDTVTGPGAKMWKKLAKKLIELGVLTEVDTHNLEFFCIAYTAYQAAWKDVQEYGEILEKENGTRYKNPALTVMHEALIHLARFGSALGLDPSARCKITGVKGKNNPFEGF